MFLSGMELPIHARADDTQNTRTLRPSIWVTPADRESILAKIDTQPWARAQFDALKERTAAGVAAHRRDPQAYLNTLSWVGAAPGEHPTLPRIEDNMASTGRANAQTAMQSLLGHAVDCGVLFYLTGERDYAVVAADVLQAFVRALRGMPINLNPGNGGWIYFNDHLYEARAVGAQIPIVYDFIAAHVREPGVTVLDLATGRRVPFAYDDAQAVFRTYARLAVEHGMSDTNWPVLEMPSLTHNTLALDDPDERAHWLAYVTHVDAERQDPLAKIFHEFEEAEGVWPESIQYSSGVAGNVTYIVSLLRRQSPALALPHGFASIPRSMLRLRDFRFPNGEYVRFGDGPRRSSPPYRSLEMAYALAEREGDAEGMREFGGVLREAVEAGELNRGRLAGTLSGASVYLAPLDLLWFSPVYAVPPVAKPLPSVSDELPFAGLVLQRNLALDGNPAHGLMAAVSGAAYVHSHASGLALELYGAGAVLGPNAGKGRYTTDEHENHRRLFAAANTVIVNGAARSSGGWVNLGIDTVRPVTLEPAVGAAPVSPHHSFMVTAFRQDHGADAPAPQERLVGLVRTSPSTGFYVDVFRSRTQAGEENQFHDYLYRNLGEEVRLLGAEGPLSLVPHPDRFKPVPGSVWRRNDTFLYPGWHVFQNVKASRAVAGDVMAQFTTSALTPRPAVMRVYMAGEAGREYVTAMAPSVAEAPDGYNNKPVPVLAVRQKGEAWHRPFAVVYEPRFADATEGVETVAPLRAGGRFQGFTVRSRVDGEVRNHLILIPADPDAGYRDETLGLTFKGRYAVVTTADDGRVLDLYVGEGSALDYRGHSLRATGHATFAARVDLQGAKPVIESRVALEYKPAR